ncbi:carbohydrate esterase family 3 protein [Apiospora phragmitis]|uniref:Carbohydrate esterase family 3 protein n=1 Tax=Apiospora phragmitis TaxID=2905665 RepID=A0ABR1V0I1_9PEZI
MPFLSRFASVVSWWRQLPSIYKLISVTLAVVFLLASGLQSGTVDVNQQWSSLVRGVGGHGSLGGGIPIRIMYIGASMTLGEHSEGERGYRQQIRDWIASKGNPVNCVGANRFGDFKDNDVQAWGAQPIKPTLDRAREIVPAVQPNLILINAGSSDCFQEGAWGSSNVLNHMRDLVEFLLEASPRATVIMSTVIMSPWPNVDRCVRSANAQIRQVSRDLAREGRPVLLAEMHRDQGGAPGRVVDLPEMGPDNMHPTTEGYFVMGDIFKEAIVEADRKGWLQRPVPNGVPEDGNAERMAEGKQEDQLTERGERAHSRRWRRS